MLARNFGNTLGPRRMPRYFFRATSPHYVRTKHAVVWTIRKLNCTLLVRGRRCLGVRRRQHDRTNPHTRPRHRTDSHRRRAEFNRTLRTRWKAATVCKYSSNTESSSRIFGRSPVSKTARSCLRFHRLRDNGGPEVHYPRRLRERSEFRLKSRRRTPTASRDPIVMSLLYSFANFTSKIIGELDTKAIGRFRTSVVIDSNRLKRPPVR